MNKKLEMLSNEEIEALIKQIMIDNMLFERNDRYSRQRFLDTVNRVMPMNEQFYVVCDETNNTPYDIAMNTANADIYFKRDDEIHHIPLHLTPQEA